MTFVDKVMNGIDTSNLKPFELTLIFEIITMYEKEGWTIEDTKEFIECFTNSSGKEKPFSKMKKLQDKYNK